MEYIVLIIGLLLCCAIFVNFLQNPVYRARIIAQSEGQYIIGVSWGHVKLFSTRIVFQPEIVYVNHDGYWFNFHTKAPVTASISRLLYQTLWLANNSENRRAIS